MGENLQDEKGKHMSNEDKGQMPQSSLWSSSEMAERWQQDVERRRQDMAEATQRMLEAAGLGPGDHALDIAAGPREPPLLPGRRTGPEASISGNGHFCDDVGMIA